MEINFNDKKLRELCEKQNAAVRKLGDACARKLRARLADLKAASCVSELVAGRPHPLKGNRLGQFSVDLEGGRRLLFKPDYPEIPRCDDGGIDWARVIRVRIVLIGDHHD